MSVVGYRPLLTRARFFGVGRVVVGRATVRRSAPAFEGGSNVKGFGRAGCVWWLEGGWLPPSPNLVKCRLRRHLANHLVNQGPYLVKRDPTVRPICTTLRTKSPLGWGLGRQVRPSLPPGEEEGLILLLQTLGMAGVGGVLALEVALVLELGFPPNFDLGLAPGSGPSLCPSIPWGRLAARDALPAP